MDRDRIREALSRRVEAPVARALASAGVTPNMLTVAGLALAGAAAYLITESALLAAGLVVLASGLFDLLDGAVARAAGRETEAGAVLDSAADRVGELGMLAAAAILLARDGDVVGVGLAFAAAGGSFMVSYLRARGEALGRSVRGGVMTRPERVLNLAGGLIIANWWPPFLLICLGVIAGLAILTSIHRLVVVCRGAGDGD